MRFWSISSPDLNNGLGCRVTFWVAGCSHHCKGCQNRETWDFESGRLFTSKEKEELFLELSKPYIKGLTLSGGDPMDSFYEILELVKEVKEKFPDKDIWLYTGYTLEELNDSFRKEIIPFIDVLVDGEFKIEERDITLKFRGSKNQRIFEKDENDNFILSDLNE